MYPISNKERLENIKESDIIDAIEALSKDEQVDKTAIIADVEWLIEQAEKLKRCSDLLSEARDLMDDVHCYDTELYHEISRYFEGD